LPFSLWIVPNLLPPEVDHGTGQIQMLNHPDDKIKHCLNQLGHFYAPKFGNPDHYFEKTVLHAAHFSLGTIAKSDAPYHDVDHTISVTLAGQAILEGLHLSEGKVTKIDWGHFSIALLFHDIGYTRGICKRDHGSLVATGLGDEVIELSVNSTDAALSRYHVDRSLMFVKGRFGAEFDTQGLFDAEVISGYIEMTRFPFHPGEYMNADPLAELIRAADLIGQLGDPHRLQKCSALYKEFEEIGLNAKLGYRRPEDLLKNNTSFYWKMVSPHIHRALACLKHTQEGRRWIANLQANVGERVI
jgi:hypothetical protein